MKYIASLLLVALFAFSCDGSDPEPTPTKKNPVYQTRSPKRGVSYGFKLVEEIQVLGSAISWNYNWGHTPASDMDWALQAYEIDFCSMAWNGVNPDVLREYKKRNPNLKYLLAFNEPNLTEESNMTPQEAAQRWAPLKAIADELDLKIVSPAMNYGTLSGYSDPIKWLDEFFQLVPLDDIYAISIHCYMPSSSATVSYINRFKKYGKPIWMTEICSWEKSDTPASQLKYMCDIVNYMECDPAVERYAWFIPRWKERWPYMEIFDVTTNASLTDLGKVFVNMSTQDKNAYYIQGQRIEAEHYNSISISEALNDVWIGGPTMQPTTDEEGGTLDLINFAPEQWVEYQVDMSEKRMHDVTIRYACFIDSEFHVEVDGDLNAVISLPATGGDKVWSTISSQINLTKGKHTLRFKLAKGRLSMNWLEVGRLIK